MPGWRTAATAVVVATVGVAGAPPAQAAPEPLPYRSGDPGGFRNILPPGSNGLANGPQLAAFLATGARPRHNDDQRDLYDDLVHAAPGLKPEDLDRYFKDASFGVRPEHVERTYSPRADVTIQRDHFGVPHITASTRDGAMFGIGYATAEDRLFFVDVLRHVGRAQLSSFAGGNQGNRRMDRNLWQTTPYTEEELERQIDPGHLRDAAARHPELRVGVDELVRLRADLDSYSAGLNAYIAEARLDASKMPGEYAAIGRPEGPDDWLPRDVVAIAALVGGIFGKGGGGELGSAMLRQAFHERFGRREGERVWRGFRAANDPEAVATVQRRFRGARVPRKPRGVAIPDSGSVVFADVITAPGGVPADGRNTTRAAQEKATGARAAGFAAAVDTWRHASLLAFPRSASNALVVSGRESESGRPLAVFGPQTGYFAPQVLMEQSVVAPGLRARGVAFPGTNLYVQLGRGADYAWSATSANNDLVDTFAVPLCDEGRGYLLRGRCTPFEILERTNAWQPNAVDTTPAGSETLRTFRTRYGPVIARGTVRGRPVAYTSARTTYFHEFESAVGFARLNNPDFLRGPREFQRAMHGVQFTFNWMYVDSERIAYFNSGGLPVRAPRVHPDFPVLASPATEWRGFVPADFDQTLQPFSAHPRSLDDQAFYANWNNKQARGYRAEDTRYNYSSVDRGELLRDRLDVLTRGDAKASLVEVVDAMEDAGTVDLRGRYLVPQALRILGRQRDPAVRRAMDTLRAWVARGAHRIDRDDDGRYEDADAVRIMDAWWPRWMRAQFTPVLGRPLAERVIDEIGLGDMPNDHLGSAFDDGIWGQAEKDLRTLLGRRVRGRLPRRFCGAGSVRKCRADLAATLREAASVKAEDLYRDRRCEAGDQRCFDEIRFVPLGGITQPGIHWINRPTFQQVVEVAGRAPR